MQPQGRHWLLRAPSSADAAFSPQPAAPLLATTARAPHNQQNKHHDHPPLAIPSLVRHATYIQRTEAKHLYTDGDGSLASQLATVPLRLAALAARTNDHYLEKRKHRRWWRRKRSAWPRVCHRIHCRTLKKDLHHPFATQVPGDTLADQHLPEPAAQLWAKLLPLALIFFCSTFNLTVLQTLKDAIVVTAAGAEALPFLASFCVLPATLAFFAFYNRIVEQLPQRVVFMVSMLPLVAFYCFFALVLYPAHGALHVHGLYESLAPRLPLGVHGLLKVVEHWTFSLFFCVAELWGAVVISVLFWTHANDVCTVEEAKVRLRSNLLCA